MAVKEKREENGCWLIRKKGREKGELGGWMDQPGEEGEESNQSGREERRRKEKMEKGEKGETGNHDQQIGNPTRSVFLPFSTGFSLFFWQIASNQPL